MSYGLWRGHNLFEAMRHRLPSQDSGVMARALSVTSLCGALLLIVFHTTAMGAGLHATISTKCKSIWIGFTMREKLGKKSSPGRGSCTGMSTCHNPTTT